MQFLIFLSSALALASAGYPYYSSHYNQHTPVVIGPHGVPLDTPEVQAAKATHAAAHAAAQHGGYLAVGHYGVPAVTADGRPIDTPEVQLARAAHFIAYNQAAYRNTVPHGHGAIDGPLDTPEVQIAKAAHFAAHAEAQAHGGHHYRKRRSPVYGYQQLPAIGPNGVPLDTPEVEAAKNAHFALKSQSSHQGPQNNYQYDDGQQYNHVQQYHGPYHIPVIGPHGVPTETPEVQAAKAQHNAAVSQAGGLYQSGHQGYQGGYQGYQGQQAYQGQHGYAAPSYNGGPPADTPEVQAARAAHLAAHSAAGAHHHY